MRLMRFIVALLFAASLSIGYMYSVALRNPLVRRAHVTMPDWPSSPPIRVVLLADIHVGPPDMPPSRLVRIVEQVNALHPDLVLIAGDFVSGKRWPSGPGEVAEAIAPLGRLRARLGTYAVRGNHDHWRGMEVRVALRKARIQLLRNQAAKVGPLSLGGLDDAFTGHSDIPATVDAMRRVPGSRVLLTHTPDVTPSVPNDISLVVAGHTHCGQISFPLIGALHYQSKYGARFGCGVTSWGAKRVITAGGLGTSMLPLRLGAVPDLWLITLGTAS